jgi:hypothetical protein
VDLGLRGRRVVSLQIEYTVVMYLTDGYFIRLDGPFNLLVDDRRICITPDTDPPERFDQLRDLVGQVITESIVDDSGVLSLSFDSGARIVSVPDGQYEAWTMAGPNGRMVVSMPSGDLAIWEAERP